MKYTIIQSSDNGSPLNYLPPGFSKFSPLEIRSICIWHKIFFPEIHEISTNKYLQTNTNIYYTTKGGP